MAFGFITAGGQTVNRIARWDIPGNAWHPLVSGGEIGVSGNVAALTVYPPGNGDPWASRPGAGLIIAGEFTTAGGQKVNNIARWDGSEWHPLTAGGQIGVGGHFESRVEALTVYPPEGGDPWASRPGAGLIVAGWFFTASNQSMHSIARWDGSAWHPLTSGGQIGVGAGTNSVRAVTVHNGDLVARGNFALAGGQTANRIARWDGSSWHPYISGDQVGVSHPVLALTVYNDDLVAAGEFITAGGKTVNRIARWDGDEWRPFTSGDQIGVSARVWALMVDNGDSPGTGLIAGGAFLLAGNQLVNRIARWDGCPERGACCVNGVGVQLFAEECAAIDGLFHGQGVPSNAVSCGPSPGNCPADLNNDGNVGVSDLLQLLANWGPCP